MDCIWIYLRFEREVFFQMKLIKKIQHLRHTPNHFIILRCSTHTSIIHLRIIKYRLWGKFCSYKFYVPVLKIKRLFYFAEIGEKCFQKWCFGNNPRKNFQFYKFLVFVQLIKNFFQIITNFSFLNSFVYYRCKSVHFKESICGDVFFIEIVHGV